VWEVSGTAHVDLVLLPCLCGCIAAFSVACFLVLTKVAIPPRCCLAPRSGVPRGTPGYPGYPGAPEGRGRLDRKRMHY
jgi:hypothetical protein